MARKYEAATAAHLDTFISKKVQIILNPLYFCQLGLPFGGIKQEKTSEPINSYPNGKLLTKFDQSYPTVILPNAQLFFKMEIGLANRAALAAELAERLLQTPEVRGSNPV